jgi:hypothetical protein
MISSETPPADLEIEEEDVIKALRTFPKFSAPGPNGLRPVHIKEALACGAAGPSSQLSGALLKFVSQAIAGELPSEQAP